MKKINLMMLLLVSLFLSLPIQAQITGDLAAKANVAPDGVTQAVPFSLHSPQATMTTFIHGLNDIKRGDASRITSVLSTLDLSAMSSVVRTEKGTDLAWILLEVMDRTRKVKLKKITNKKQGEKWVFETYKEGEVALVRQSDGRWLFSQQTLLNLSNIFDGLANIKRKVGSKNDKQFLPFYIRIQSSIPEGLKETGFILQNWKWAALLVIIAVGVILDWLVSFILRLNLKIWKKKRKSQSFDDVPENTLRPLGLMAMALVWLAGINLLGLPESTLLVLLLAVKFLASLSGVWVAYRFVDMISAWLKEKASQTTNTLDDVLAPLIPRVLKIFVTVVGFVFIANNMNLDITGLLAGLGLGGLAFALAAKDMVQNLFGSLTVLLDRTFTVGDWIIVDGAEGSVESIGFRSTRIRTFYNSLLTVPNSIFITANVDNMGQRRFRRLSTKYGIAYDTPADKIEAFCEGIRELVRQHPYMRKDYYHVYLNGLGESALEIMVYVFWETPDWSTELRERHRFLLDCLRLAEKLGVEYAFPTQTIYMKNEVATTTSLPEKTQIEAFTEARDLAKGIVDSTTGLGKKPGKVEF